MTLAMDDTHAWKGAGSEVRKGGGEVAEVLQHREGEEKWGREEPTMPDLCDQ